MATQTYTIPEGNVGPQGFTSAGFNLPSGLDNIQIQLTSSDWFTTTGTVDVRIDVLRSGTWVAAVTVTGINMGDTNHQGGLPIIGVGASSFTDATQVRANVVCNPRIKLGAVITVTTVP